MNTLLKPLDLIVKELSPLSQAEVRDFAEFLLEKRKLKPVNKLSQSWAGSLSDLKTDYTSLELQKKALDWRG